MKKLFLFIYLVGIAGYVGYSQMSLTLSDSTGALPPNTTIHKHGTPQAEEILAYIFVKNTSAVAVPVMVKKVVLDTVPGSYNMFCWGLCFSPAVYVSPNPITVNPGRTDSTDFSGHFVPNNTTGSSSMRYVFFSRANPLDSVCVNVSYGAYPLGVATLAENSRMSSAFPNPANNSTTISYSLPVSSSGSIIIRNLLGVVVKEVELQAGSGKVSVSTSDLPEGVYFYSLNMDGKTDNTKKLIIRH